MSPMPSFLISFFFNPPFRRHSFICLRIFFNFCAFSGARLSFLMSSAFRGRRKRKRDEIVDGSLFGLLSDFQFDVLARNYLLLTPPVRGDFYMLRLLKSTRMNFDFGDFFQFEDFSLIKQYNSFFLQHSRETDKTFIHINLNFSMKLIKRVAEYNETN